MDKEKFIVSEFLGVDDFVDEQAESVLAKLLKVVEEERRSISRKKEEFEEQEAKIQSEVDSLR